jgi:hypothetical protein
MQAVTDELPRVTVSMLRRAEDMCRRRLSREHTGRKNKANPASDARFAVSSRIEADARLAHAEDGPPRAEAFVDPSDLEPEQRRFYRAAANGYLGFFRETPGRIVDLGWMTAYPELGVVLIANVGLAIELSRGDRELRMLQFGVRSRLRPVLDPVAVNVALLRTAEWAARDLKIVAADLIDNDLTVHEPRLPDDRDVAHAWFAERVELVRDLAADARPRAGGNCLGCAFVAGCPPHLVA